MTNKGLKRGQVCFKDKCFDVELAQTQEEKERGLMFREKLDPNKGMLFIYEDEGIRSFWMKNVQFPLDIIWINEKKEVVFISENVQPCEKNLCSRIKTDIKAKYVLEINAGACKKGALKMRDNVRILEQGENK